MSKQMNDSFFIGPQSELTFGYLMHAVTKQGCILYAERGVDIRKRVGAAIVIGCSDLPGSGSEWSQRGRMGQWAALTLLKIQAPAEAWWPDSVVLPAEWHTSAL